MKKINFKLDHPVKPNDDKNMKPGDNEMEKAENIELPFRKSLFLRVCGVG